MMLAMCPTWYGSALRYLHLYIPFVGEIPCYTLPWYAHFVLVSTVLKKESQTNGPWYCDPVGSKFVLEVGGFNYFPTSFIIIYLYLGYFNIFYIGWWSKMAKDFSGLKPPAISCFTADPASFRSNRQGRSAASMHVGKLDSFNFIHMSYSFAQWNMPSK